MVLLQVYNCDKRFVPPNEGFSFDDFGNQRFRKIQYNYLKNHSRLDLYQEGLIPPVETKETREDIAESYLDGLIDRCMVQVGLIKANGKIKTCGIHNLMRELSLLHAREEIFFEVVVQDDNRSAVSSKVYRLAIHGDGYDPQAMRSDTLGSLTVFVKRGPGYSRCLISTLSCFKLLRQLTLNGCLDESAT